MTTGELSAKETAISLANLGIPVIPLHTPNSGKCSCNNPKCDRPGKHPRISGGVSNASTDVATVTKWWNEWPNANVGMATSEVVVVDVDGQKGKQSASKLFPKLEATVITGSGGYHLYFENPKDKIKNAVGVFPGIDVRTSGGYVVVPPSLHVSGRRYQWATAVPFGMLPELPQKILHALTSNGHQEKLVAADWDKVIESGSRNQELTRRAGKLLSSEISPRAVLDILRSINSKQCKPPLKDDELIRIVKSIWAKESKKPKTEPESKEFQLLNLHDTLRKYGGFEYRWSIEGWLPEATVGMVVAPPGSYKTWILSDLCLSMVGARKFLGRVKPEKTGPVIVIQQEDFMPMLINRMSLMLGAGKPTERKGEISLPIYREDFPIYFHDRRSLHMENKASLDGLRARVEELKPSLIMLDPLYSAVSMKDYMSESAQGMVYFKDLRDQFGVSVMVAHHTVKRPGHGDRDRDDLWGSQFLNAWLETGWQMRMEDEGGRIRVYRHFKTTPPVAPVDLQFNIDEWNYSVEVVEDDI